MILSCPATGQQIYKEGIRLIIEPASKPSLLSLLATLSPLDEELPTIEDPPVTDNEQVF